MNKPCVILVVLIGCAHASPKPTPASLVVATAAPPTQAELDAIAERRERADEAVVALAEKLEEVDQICRDRWMEPKSACKDPSFATIAVDYQAEFADHDDPHAHEGRIDALPRLGGRDVPPKEVEDRIERACEARCDLARRIGMAGAKEEAIEKCTIAKKPADECKSLGAHVAPDAPPSVKSVVSDCESACESRRKDLLAALAREANRPRTLAQRHTCFRECMRSCTGGRIVPDANGNYTRPPDDWCGTCDVSCDSSCAVKP